MKEVQYEKQLDLNKRLKAFSIGSESEDTKSKTKIRKSFKYRVDWADEPKPKNKAPLVFIRKSFDTHKGVESFSFHVKGCFFITHHNEMIKVCFNHTLDITIHWKAKDFSNNKSISVT